MTVRPVIITTFTLISVSILLLAGCGESEQAKLDPVPKTDAIITTPSTEATISQPDNPPSSVTQPAETTSPVARQPGRDAGAGRAATRGARNIGAVNGSTDSAVAEKDAGTANADGDAAAATADVSTGSHRVSIPAPAEPTGRSGTDPGDTIMEIKGQDLDEERFALSDYQGKVIMLDFWGDW